MKKTLATVFLSLAVMAPHGLMAEQPDTYGTKLGTVKFPVSCNKAVQRLMARGLALVHHMTFKGGYAAFAAAQKKDPNCALAYWGMAMTYIHPVWPDSPSKAQFKQRAGASRPGQEPEAGKRSWEKAYIAAVEAYYANAEKRTERSRLASYSQAWAKVHKSFPNDQGGRRIRRVGASVQRQLPGQVQLDSEGRRGDVWRSFSPAIQIIRARTTT